MSQVPMPTLTKESIVLNFFFQITLSRRFLVCSKSEPFQKKTPWSPINYYNILFILSYNEWNFTKLRLWTLRFEKIIYLDADCLVLHSIDYLFSVSLEENVIYAAPNCDHETLPFECDSKEFNSGTVP